MLKCGGLWVVGGAAQGTWRREPKGRISRLIQGNLFAKVEVAERVASRLDSRMPVLIRRLRLRLRVLRNWAVQGTAASHVPTETFAGPVTYLRGGAVSA